MELNNKIISLACLTYVLLLNGCGLIEGADTKSLEAHGDRVRVTMATLITYIGKSKDEVRRDFGEPTEIKKPGWLAGEEYQELWYYIYRRGIPGINAEGSTKRFFFNQGKVVSVDAF